MSDALTRIGSADAVPKRNEVADFSGLNLTAEDFFLLSRIDGQSSVHNLAQLTGQSDAAVAEKLVRMADIGLVSIPMARSGAQARSAAATSNPTSSRPTSRPGQDNASGGTLMKSERKSARAELTADLVPDGWPVPFSRFTVDDTFVSGSEPVEAEAKRVVMYYQQHLRRVTYYQLFGLEQGADRRSIKKAYFQLSKAFHPDRWFRKDVGDFGTYVEEVFKWLNRAYNTLSSPQKRKQYDKILAQGMLGEWEYEERKRAHRARRRKSATSNEDKTFEILKARGGNAHRAGKHRDAIQAYEQALRIKNDAELRLSVAACRLDAKAELSRVFDDVKAALNAGADVKTALLLQLRAATELGDTERAAGTAREILSLDPDNSDAKAALSRST